MPTSTSAYTSEPMSEYVGFWPRAGSYLIDSALLTVVVFVGLLLIFGTFAVGERVATTPSGRTIVLVVAVLLAVVLVVGSWAYFAVSWLRTGATLGQRWLGQQVVDADTFGPLQPWQAWVRVLGYALSGMFWYLGFLWVAFEPRKRGWHDLIARTVVIPAGY